MTEKVALITGVTGQDGSLLARLLLDKGYVVHGIKRRSSSFNTERVDDIYVDPHESESRFLLHYGDMTDATNLIRIVQETQPDEIYNLAAQSHVQVSFETPEYTANADALGTLRLLEAMRILGLEDSSASTRPRPRSCTARCRRCRRRETTPFYPRSPYGVAKLYAYWITVNYREAYGLLRRQRHPVQSREPDARRDLRHPQDHPRRRAPSQLGSARHASISATSTPSATGAMPSDYVKGMWLILQQPKPDDYVLATGESHSVREFVELAFAQVGRTVVWRGSGDDEVGVDNDSGQVLVKIDRRYFRPTEVDVLQGDASKAKRELGWEAETTFTELVAEMVKSDLELLGKDPNAVARLNY